MKTIIQKAKEKYLNKYYIFRDIKYLVTDIKSAPTSNKNYRELIVSLIEVSVIDSRQSKFELHQGVEKRNINRSPIYSLKFFEQYFMPVQV